MSNPEKLKTFNKDRRHFSPYGLTCELWTPSLMPGPDRHNEIELNYFPTGNITYLFSGRKVIIPPKRLALFWGLVPHQIISYEGDGPYYVCTIPFTRFLSWKLSTSFTDQILKGRVILETTDHFSIHDEFMMKNWLCDISDSDGAELVLLEMRARLLRMSIHVSPEEDRSAGPIHGLSLVEQMAVYIARNYFQPLSVSDIGKAVGLHPDYANSIFKKAFGCTLYEYVIQERIAHAQRKLVLSDLSITEIAFDCGFNSISRFNAAFLKLNAYKPCEYRKRYTTK